MKITIFVARFRNAYGIGLTAKDAEATMLDQKFTMPEVFRDEDGGSLFPNPKSRSDCEEFCTESVEIHDKREKFLREFRAEGSMIQCPDGVTHVWVDDWGTARWEGTQAEAITLKYDSEKSPSWQPA